MPAFVALYQGETIEQARLIAVSVDPPLIADVSARLLHQQQDEHLDPVVQSIEQGRRRALRLVNKQAQHDREDRTT